MKRTIVIFIVFFGFVSHAYALTGDVYPIGSSDGKVTIDDAVAALRMVAGLVTPDVKADVAPLGHPDGQVNVGDALILARTALNSMVIYAPVTAGATGKEGQAIAFSTASLLSQFGSAGSNGLSKVIVTSLPSNGTLNLSGNPVAMDQVIDSANLENLIFTPTSYWNGSTGFTYNASDGKSYTTSGVTANITLAAVNDPPTTSNFSRTGDEDTIIAFTSNDFIGKFSDVDGNSLSKIKITSLPINGTLRLSGNSVNLNQEIDAVGLGSLTFTPDSNWNGDTSFTYNGSDGTIYAISGAIVNITVTAVNDPPTVDSVSRTGVEDTIISFTNADFTSKFGDVDGNNLSKIKTTSLPTNGILKLGGNAVIVGQEIDSVGLSNLTFTPNLNWNGTTSFNYNAGDGITYAVSGAVVNIAVTAANDAPIAANSTLTTNEDTVGTGTLTASDIDDNTMTYSIVANGFKGTATVNASTGAYSYTPNANANGVDAFTFKVNDGVSDSNTVTVTVTITSANDAPAVSNGTLTTDEDTAGVGMLTASDIENNILYYSILSNGIKGTATITNAATGAYKYIPNPNASGTDTFTFKVDDGTVDSSTAIVTVTIDPTNDAPTSSNGTLTTNEDTAGTGTLIASDVENNILTYSIVTNGSKGTVTIVNTATGAYTYTPNPNTNGTDTFTFKVNDGTVDSSTAVVTVTINSVNDAPTASNGTLTTSEDAAGSGILTVSDIDGNALAFSIVTNGSKGTATITNTTTGAYTYTPNLNANGTDTFTFKVNDGTVDSNTATVTIAITPVHDAPTALNGTLTTDEDTVGTGTIAAGNPDNSALTYNIVTNGSKGTATITNTATGAYTYTPNLNAYGTDTFTFKVNDGTADSNTATVTIAITPVHDASIALNGTLTTNEDTAGVGTLTTNNTEGSALTYSIMTNGSKGTATITNTTTGAYTYTPNLNANGADTFTFKVSDGTVDSNLALVTVTITPVNDAPSASPGTLITNEDAVGGGTLHASDLDNDSLTYSIVTNSSKGIATITNGSTGAFSYTPDSDANGTDTFTFKANDGSSISNTATVTVTITPANDTPVASNGSLITNEDVAGTGTLIASDLDNDSLNYAIVTNGTKGTVTITNASTGAYLYTPNPNINGTDTFTFRVNDGTTNSSTVTVAVTITPVDDAPTASNSTLTTDEDTAGTGTLTGNDLENSILTYSIVANGSKGTVTISNASTGAYTYTPNPNVNGTDVFTFRVSDGTIDSSAATVTVTITPVNDDPVANAGNDQSVSENATVTLSGSGTGIDGTIVSYAWSQVSGPSVSLNDAGTASASFTAPLLVSQETLVFRLTVVDNNGKTGNSNVNVAVNPVPRIISINTGNNTLMEGNVGTTDMIVTLSLNLAANQVITVNYATSDGSAVADRDYMSTSGTVTFNIGDTTKTITIRALGDTKDEPTRTFSFALSSPVNATINNGTAAITITDDDPEPTVAFVSVSQSVNEASLLATATLQLSAVSGMDISVPFTVSGTATAGINYAGLTSSPVTIAAGSLSRIITFNASTVDSNKTVTFALGTPTYATLGGVTTHTVTINNVITPIVPKTGQTTSYATGDDGSLQKGVAWPSPRFTNNSNGTITDRLTNLVWLYGGAYSGSWGNALGSANTLANGQYGLTDQSSSGDWRVPNYRELESLFDYQTMKQTASYPGTVTLNAPYWSSTPLPPAAGSVRTVMFFSASTPQVPNQSAESSSSGLHLPVRGQSSIIPKTGMTTTYFSPYDDGATQKGLTWPTPRFVDMGDGTVVDALTSLVWMKNAACWPPMDWSAALTKITNLNSATAPCSGYTGSQNDWRLPNIREIMSLIDYGKSIPPPLLPTNHPFLGNMTPYVYWSSSNMGTNACVMYLDSGFISCGAKTSSSNVWPVRGGQ